VTRNHRLDGFAEVNNILLRAAYCVRWSIVGRSPGAPAARALLVDAAISRSSIASPGFSTVTHAAALTAQQAPSGQSHLCFVSLPVLDASHAAPAVMTLRASDTLVGAAMRFAWLSL